MEKLKQKSRVDLFLMIVLSVCVVALISFCLIRQNAAIKGVDVGVGVENTIVPIITLLVGCLVSGGRKND